MSTRPPDPPTPHSLFDAWKSSGADEVALNDLLQEHPELGGQLLDLVKTYESSELLKFHSDRRDREQQKDVDSQTGPVLKSGVMLGNYKLVRPVGRGGMGVVWEAEDQRLRRSVALKMILPSRVDSRGLELFSREARAGGRLSHPSIVTVFEHGKEEHLAWIAMELVQGGWTLKDFIEEAGSKTGLSGEYFRKLARLVAALADAMQHAHEAGVIHRDLKPANVLITKEEVPKIVDFGLARISDESAISRTGEFAGTYLYMSPEQVTARRIGLDHRTDVFSLGVVLYELLTFRRPFEGDSAHQVAEQIMFEDPPDPRSIRSRIPEDLAVICGKCMEKERRRRYESMGDLAADLRHFLAGEPIAASPPSALQLAAKWSRRNPVKTAAAVMALCALLVIALFWRRAERARVDEATARHGAEEAREQAEVAESKTRLALEQVEAERDRARSLLEFQEGRLREVDLGAMGISMMRLLRQGIARDLEEKGASADEIAKTVGVFQGTVVRANPTEVARKLFGEHVLDRASAAIESMDLSADPQTESGLLQATADSYRTLGILDRAVPLQERVLELRREIHGERGEETIIAAGMLASLASDRGRLEEAETALRATLEKAREVLGREHETTLTLIGALGRLLQRRGKMAEAELVCREALNGRRRVLGDDHPDTLLTVQLLGRTLHAAGDLQEAEPILLEALRGRRRVLGALHSETLGSINDMGRLLMDLGRLAEARPYYVEALDGLRATLGDDHPSTLRAMESMGSLLRLLSELDEAEPYCQGALDGRRETLGVEHPDTVGSLSNLASLLVSQGRLFEAETYFREALDIQRRVLGGDHSDTMTSLNNLGVVLGQQGKLRKAERFYREALETARRVFGEDHQTTLHFLVNMGGLFQAQGRFEQAEQCLREAVAGLRASLTDEHPSTLSGLMSLAGLLDAQGRYDEAGPYYREVYETRQRVLGAGHPDTLRALSNVGVLLKNQGRLGEAETYYHEALERSRSELGPSHPNTLNCLNNLGVLLQTQGKLTEAEPHFRDAWQNYGELLGEGHPKTLNVANNLGALLRARGDLEGAAEVLRQVLEGMQRALGEGNRRTLRTCQQLVEVLRDSGDLESAHELCVELIRHTPEGDPTLAGRQTLLRSIDKGGGGEPDLGGRDD